MKAPQIIKSYKNLAILCLFFILTATTYLWFINTPYFESLKNLTQNHLILLFIVLSILKAIGIIWPPLPGTIITIGSVPIIGWYPAFLADSIGNIIGSTVAYYLGRKYGFQFLYKIFDEKIVEKVKRIKVKKGRETEIVFVLRIITGTTMVEVICYAAGLIKIKYMNFLVGSALSQVVVALPFFIAWGGAIVGRNILLNIIILILIVVFIWKLKGRYFE